MKKNIIDKDLNDYYKRIGQNVAKQRNLKNVSQLNLANAIGHESTTIISLAEINKGKHFSLKHLYEISKYLEIDICELMKS